MFLAVMPFFGTHDIATEADNYLYGKMQQPHKFAHTATCSSSERRKKRFLCGMA